MSTSRLRMLNQLVIPILSNFRNGKSRTLPAGSELSMLDSPGLYFIREKRPNRCYDLFARITRLGIEGFIVSREHPGKVVQHHMVPDVPMYWLSRIGVENSVNPENLMDLAEMAENFCSRSGVCVIVLDGLEYLISERGFHLVLEFLNELQHLMVAYGSRLIMPLHQGALSLVEYDNLEERFTIL
ncbi:MAG: DUF835 domain-containing protein [Theionarchaea archaeon]|nr:DUF835 domain-containing protein [Theionarchaea archaeon]